MTVAPTSVQPVREQHHRSRWVLLAIVAFLAKDDAGTVQVFAVPVAGGGIRALSRLDESVDTPFSWSPDGRTIANYGSIRFLGLPIGRLRETITLEQRSQTR